MVGIGKLLLVVAMNWTSQLRPEHPQLLNASSLLDIPRTLYVPFIPTGRQGPGGDHRVSEEAGYLRIWLSEAWLPHTWIIRMPHAKANNFSNS